MEAKRRLPSWMAVASTSNKASEPDENNVITKEEASVVTRSRKPKAKAATSKDKKEVGVPNDGKNVLVKCETRRKKRELVEKDVIERRNPEQEVVGEKRKRGRVRRKEEEEEEHEPSRNKEEKGYEFESNNENEAPSDDDDEEDEDLTVDDLLSIAKEFVANDKSDIHQQKPPEGPCKWKSKSSYTSSSVTTTSLVVPQATNSPMQEAAASHHDPIEKTTSKVTLADSISTGDPAQDMLDLFLGPLLKKPIRKEETVLVKDIILPHEVKNQQQNDAAISDKPVILTKKKSSLRDAVAMLLD